MLSDDPTRRLGFQGMALETAPSEIPQEVTDNGDYPLELLDDPRDRTAQVRQVFLSLNTAITFLSLTGAIVAMFALIPEIPRWAITTGILVAVALGAIARFLGGAGYSQAVSWIVTLALAPLLGWGVVQVIEVTGGLSEQILVYWFGLATCTLPALVVGFWAAWYRRRAPHVEAKTGVATVCAVLATAASLLAMALNVAILRSLGLTAALAVAMLSIFIAVLCLGQPLRPTALIESLVPLLAYGRTPGTPGVWRPGLGAFSRRVVFFSLLAPIVALLSAWAPTTISYTPSPEAVDRRTEKILYQGGPVAVPVGPPIGFESERRAARQEYEEALGALRRWERRARHQERVVLHDLGSSASSQSVDSYPAKQRWELKRAYETAVEEIRTKEAEADARAQSEHAAAVHGAAREQAQRELQRDPFFGGVWRNPDIWELLARYTAGFFLYPAAVVYQMLALLALWIQVLRDRMPELVKELGGPALWNWANSRLASAQLPVPTTYVGKEIFSGKPVLTALDQIWEHCHITGSSGSRKTSCGIQSILKSALMHHDMPVMVIDLKGEPELLQAVKDYAGEERFRWFSLDPTRSSYGFDPCADLSRVKRSFGERAAILLQAMGANATPGWGRSYYSSQMHELLIRPLRDPTASRNIQTLNDYLQALKKSDPKALRDAGHIVSILYTLAEYDRLSPDPDDPNVITLADVFENNRVVYVHAPTVLASTVGAHIARLFLAAWTDTAKSYHDRGETKRGLVFIDEVEKVVGDGSNLDGYLQLSRSQGTGIVLANQSMQDLRMPDGYDLRPVVDVNTRVKLHFDVSELAEMERISKLSGEELLVPGTVDSRQSPVADEEDLLAALPLRIGPRWSLDMIQRYINGLDGTALMSVKRPSGPTPGAGFYFGVELPFVDTEDDYERRKKEPWPELPISWEPPACPAEPKEDIELELRRAEEEIEDFLRRMAEVLGQPPHAAD